MITDSRLRRRLALVSILTAAAALRLAGIGFGLHHPDEHLVIHHALSLGPNGLNPHMFYYPTFFLYQLFAVFAGICGAGWLAGVFAGPDGFLRWFLERPDGLYVAARTVSALYGTGTVLAVYFLGRVYSNRRTGILAAALLAVCYAHVRDSHYATVDAALTFYTTLSACWFLAYMRSYKRAHLIFAAGLAGLATSVKYNAAILLPTFGVGYLLMTTCYVNRPSFALSFPRLLRDAAAAAAAWAVFFLLGSPFIALSWAEASSFIFKLRAINASFAHSPWYHLRVLFWGAGPLTLAAAAAGFVRGKAPLARKWWLFSAAVACYALVARMGQPHERYVLPLYPFLAVLAAEGCVGLFTRKKGPPRRRLTAAAALLVAAYPLAASVQSDAVLTRTDTRELAREWVERNVPAGTRIAIDNPMYAPRLLPTPEQIRRMAESVDPDSGRGLGRAKRIRLEILEDLAARSGRPVYRLAYLSEQTGPAEFSLNSPMIPFDAAELAAGDTRYLLTSQVAVADRPAFYRDLRKDYRLAARFGPGPDGAGAPATHWTHLPFDHELWGAERPGPEVQVWEKRRPS